MTLPAMNLTPSRPAGSGPMGSQAENLCERPQCMGFIAHTLEPNEAEALRVFLGIHQQQTEIATEADIAQALAEVEEWMMVPAHARSASSPSVSYLRESGTAADEAGILGRCHQQGIPVRVLLLDAAIDSVKGRESRPLVHADRGGHYRWPGWLTRMSNAKLIRSMSRIVCSPDNAACARFFGRLKTELFYPRNWQDVSVDQFTETIDSYIRWYSEKRIKVSLASLSPLEYRASLGIAA